MALPVTLDDAKRQLRVEIDDGSRNAEIGGFIADAAAWVEKHTGHILEARNVTERFGSFSRLQLRAWPVLPGAVVTVSYNDAAGAAIALAGARILLDQRPATIWPAYSTCWPWLSFGSRVSVTVRAGYESPADVPGNLRRAMLVLIGGYDADREGGDAFKAAEASARSLCSDFRLRRL